MMSNRATALTATPSKVIICINLKAIHKVMEAFTPNENSQKIRRALAHNIRTSGDQIHYRRPCLLQTCRQQEWHGLTRVLGKDGQQVLVKNRSAYVRVHPCRLQLIPPSPRPTPETETTIKTPNPQNAKLTHYPASFRPQTHHLKKKPAAVKMMMKIPKNMGTTTQSHQNNKKTDTTDTTKQRFEPK